MSMALGGCKSILYIYVEIGNACSIPVYIVQCVCRLVTPTNLPATQTSLHFSSQAIFHFSSQTNLHFQTRNTLHSLQTSFPLPFHSPIPPGNLLRVEESLSREAERLESIVRDLERVYIPS
jgi:hypothetical protein